MVANVKYYVVTIVSIFLAIGLGIFIGFMLNAQDILSSQREDIVAQLETKFDYLKEENEKTKAESQKINDENEKLNEFNKIIYPELISGKLEGLNVAIIETNSNYLYSEVNQTLEMSGANIVSNTIIKDTILTDLDRLKDIYKDNTGKESSDIVNIVISEITNSIISGETTPLITALNDQGFIDISKAYDQEVDYIVIGGGNNAKNEKEDNSYKLIDQTIIDIAKKYEKSIVGIEKVDVENSYIDKYKESRISSVDNVETTIGKMTLVLVMDGNPGNYGVKPSADSLAPELNNPTKE